MSHFAVNTTQTSVAHAISHLTHSKYKVQNFTKPTSSNSLSQSQTKSGMKLSGPARQLTWGGSCGIGPWPHSRSGTIDHLHPVTVRCERRQLGWIVDVALRLWRQKGLNNAYVCSVSHLALYDELRDDAVGACRVGPLDLYHGWCQDLQLWCCYAVRNWGWREIFTANCFHAIYYMYVCVCVRVCVCVVIIITLYTALRLCTCFILIITLYTALRLCNCFIVICLCFIMAILFTFFFLQVLVLY